MSKDFLQRYKVHLKTIGPVFIGSGQEIGKREWILDRRSRTGYIIDELKLFNYLNKKNLLESYEKYMLKDNRDLYRWASDNGLFPDNMKTVIKYTLDCNDVSNVNTMKSIKTFIKDAYGKPYIPGSSVKGALRNVILEKFIATQHNKLIEKKIIDSAMGVNFKNSKTYLKGESNQLITHYLHILERNNEKKGDAVNDIMSGLRISDSKPLEFSDLTLCQKVDVNVAGNERDMPIFRECIKPGTDIVFDLTIDTMILNISIQDIEDAIVLALDNYNNEFLSKFESEELYQGNVIYIGGGAGYHTKTATSVVLENYDNKVNVTANIINNTIASKIRKEHGHAADKRIGVSPHIVKLTEYDGKLMQFGPCRISFEEI